METSTNKVINGPIWKNMLSYFMALLLGAFFQQFYNTVDAVIVGKVVVDGSNGLAAVGGSAATVVSLFVGFFLGLSSGATVVIAQFFGADRKEEVSKAVHTAIAMAILGGAIISVVGFAIAPWFIGVMKTPAEVSEASIFYLRIYFLGMIPNLVYNMGAGILRAVGDSKRPLYVLIISCFTNVFLDLLFVIGFGMGFKSMTMGVIAVAIATILCQLLSAIIVVIMLVKATNSYKLVPRNIKLDMGMLMRIIRIGLPAGIQTTMYTLSNMLIQTSINELGTDSTSAWAAYGKIDVVFWMTISSLGTAVTTFAGQNFGAGKFDRVHRSIRTAFVIAFAITLPLSTFLYFYGELFLRIFVNNKAVIDIGVQMIKYLAPFYFTYIGVEVFSGVLRGMGTALVPMFITLSGICVLRVVWILVAFPLNKTVETVEFSYPLTWTVTTALFAIYYIYYTRKKKI